MSGARAAAPSAAGSPQAYASGRWRHLGERRFRPTVRAQPRGADPGGGRVLPRRRGTDRPSYLSLGLGELRPRSSDSRLRRVLLPPSVPPLRCFPVSRRSLRDMVHPTHRARCRGSVFVAAPSPSTSAGALELPRVLESPAPGRSGGRRRTTGVRAADRARRMNRRRGLGVAIPEMGKDQIQR